MEDFRLPCALTVTSDQTTAICGSLYWFLQLSISYRLGRRRYFSLFRRVIRQIINNAASWRPDLPLAHERGEGTTTAV